MKKLAILALSAVCAMGFAAVSYAADSTSEASSTTMMKADPHSGSMMKADNHSATMMKADKHPGTMMKKEKKHGDAMAMKKKDEVKNPCSQQRWGGVSVKSPPAAVFAETSLSSAAQLP
ncbi:Uncharacterised protein [Raoultella terrigena]|uniref:Pentapeptide MXKDX repeat protein n=1 Tax=Raoultella terrigena TaxID=577 RepID=A0A3P8LYG0_RAOTE|nr:Uncharacterised protein [Raoultella terrigena]